MLRINLTKTNALYHEYLEVLNNSIFPMIFTRQIILQPPSLFLSSKYCIIPLPLIVAYWQISEINEDDNQKHIPMMINMIDNLKFLY